MAHYIIYVPGLGDHRAKAQRLAVRLWRLYGVRGVFEPVHWSDGKPFEPKLQSLLDRIDELSMAGYTVSLVAASAGASAALVAYERRKHQLTGIVCICGKINHIEAVNPEYYRKNPAFKESLAALARVLPNLSAQDRQRILCLRPLYDELVPVEDAVLSGASTKTLPVAGHAIGIGYAITIGFYTIRSFVRRLIA